MKVFTIDENNTIAAHASVEDADAVVGSERFRSEAGLEKIAADWPMIRLVAVWNGLPGVTEVSKFKNRDTGVSRIWKQIQNLAPTITEQPESVSEQGEQAAPVEATPAVTEESPETDNPPAEPLSADLPATEPQNEEHAPTPATDVEPQGADVAPETAPSNDTATPAKKPRTKRENAAPRAESKTAQVIAMLKREEGTTVEEIMTSMGWLKHTTRAMLSAGGSLTKNHGLTITSEKVGEIRRYYIKS